MTILQLENKTNSKFAYKYVISTGHTYIAYNLKIIITKNTAQKSERTDPSSDADCAFFYRITTGVDVVKFHSTSQLPYAKLSLQLDWGQGTRNSRKKREKEDEEGLECSKNTWKWEALSAEYIIHGWDISVPLSFFGDARSSAVTFVIRGNFIPLIIYVTIIPEVGRLTTASSLPLQAIY